VIELIGQMLRAPLALLGWSAQLMIKGLRALQPGAAVPTPINLQAGTPPPSVAAPPAGAAYLSRPEEPQMSDQDDQDLSGDDLKYVRYSILFTKRDVEATLQADREELVDYSTDGASFGALRISDFTARLLAGQVPLPEAWKWHYPGPNPPEYGWKVPGPDRRYITLVYSVVRRLPLQEGHYQRAQVEHLRGIDHSLHEINRKFGP
jgi:hypothetical protein